MSENYEPMLVDPNSYESPDGDILPYADIDEPQPIEAVKIPLSDEYIIADGIIQEGIAKSKESGYNKIKVEFWVNEEGHSNGGYQTRISLAQLFGGNSLRRMVTNQEYDELFAKYGDVSHEHAEQRARQFGAIAASRHNPIIESGHRRYRDAQSAAAGDYLEDE